MATANITWTNNSTATVPGPTHTAIDRVEQTAFTGLSAAPMISRVASGNSGGLDPTAATGSYQDTTVSPGKNYSYKVVTGRSSDEVESISTPHSYVYDINNELGYPSGYPVTAAYNVSVDPMVHIDVNRLGGSTPDVEEIVNDFSGAVRYGDTVRMTDTRVSTQDPSNRWELREETINGNLVRCLYNILPDTQVWGSVTIHTDNAANYIYSEDEVTAFWVVKKSAAGWYVGNILGSYDTSKRELTPGKYCSNGQAIMYWLSSNGTWNFTHSSSTANMSGTLAIPDDNLVVAVRYNATAAHYAANNMKMQIFVNGALIGTSADISDKSYHQWAPGDNPPWNQAFGAYRLHGNSPSTHSNNIHMGYYYNYQRHGHYEYMAFPQALDAADMNQIFSYACNRYGITNQTQVQASDLIS